MPLMTTTSAKIKSCDIFTMSLMEKRNDSTALQLPEPRHPSIPHFNECCKSSNSITRQNRIRKLLQNLRLSQILKTKNCSVSEALAELCENITQYTPQGPPARRSDPDKTEYLYDAVIGTEWAKPVLTQSLASTPPWTFQQMCSALDAAWLQEQKQNESRKPDPFRTHLTMAPLPGIHFQRQST